MVWSCSNPKNNILNSCVCVCVCVCVCLLFATAGGHERQSGGPDRGAGGCARFAQEPTRRGHATRAEGGGGYGLQAYVEMSSFFVNLGVFIGVIACGRRSIIFYCAMTVGELQAEHGRAVDHLHALHQELVSHAALILHSYCTHIALILPLFGALMLQ